MQVQYVCACVIQHLNAGRVGYLVQMHIDSKMLSKTVPVTKDQHDPHHYVNYIQHDWARATWRQG